MHRGPRYEGAGLSLVCANGVPSHVSGFTLARHVDPVRLIVETLDGRRHPLLGTIDRVCAGHYRISSIGAAALPPDLVPRLPDGMTFVSDYATEVPAPLRSALTDVMRRHLPSFDIAPDFADPPCPDGDGVALHVFDGNTHRIGWWPASDLAALGLSHHPLDEAARPGQGPSSTAIPLLARKPRFRPSALSWQKQAAFARIKHYSDAPEYAGVHEYCVDCLYCQRRSDLPNQMYAPQNLRLRCPYCGDDFAVEYVRTGLSLRTHGW